MSPARHRPLFASLLVLTSLLARDAHAEPPAPPKPASPPAATLRHDELLARWLDKSPEVASWRAQAGAARFDLVSAKVWPNPSTQVAGVFNADGTPPDGKRGVVVQLYAPLPIFGQIGARRAAADAQITVAELTLATLLWSASGALVDAMVDRAFADARHRLLVAQQAELERLRAVVTARAAAGATTTYDLLRTSQAQATLKAALDGAEADRDRAEARLVALIGDASLSAAPITREGLPAATAPESDATVIEQALERRPDLALARRSITAALAVGERAKRDAVPIPALFLQGYLVQQPYGLQFQAGVSMPLPVFDRNQGAVGRAHAEARGHELMATAIDARTRAEVQSAIRQRRAAKAALDGFNASTVESSSQLLKRAETTYTAGHFTVVELFDAYQTVWVGRVAQLDLEERLARADAELIKSAVLLRLAR